MQLLKVFQNRTTFSKALTGSISELLAEIETHPQTTMRHLCSRSWESAVSSCPTKMLAYWKHQVRWFIAGKLRYYQQSLLLVPASRQVLPILERHQGTHERVEMPQEKIHQIRLVCCLTTFQLKQWPFQMVPPILPRMRCLERTHEVSTRLSQAQPWETSLGQRIVDNSCLVCDLKLKTITKIKKIG